MPTITIRQLPSSTRAKTPAKRKFKAEVQFSNGEATPITITDPLTTEDKALLAWYFEEWLREPYLGGAKPKEAAARIEAAGEVLFRQVFGKPEVFARYVALRNAELDELTIEIASDDPAFHGLHWEALRDPSLKRPLSLDAIFVRRNRTFQPMPAAAEARPTINVLVVSARPRGAFDVSYRTISRPLVQTLEQAKLRVRVDILRPGTYKALTEHLLQTRDTKGDGFYHVIHFDVHGGLLRFDQFEQYEKELPQPAGHLAFQGLRYGRPRLDPYEGLKGFLFLETEGPNGEEKADPVEARELADLLKTHKAPVAILNACQSGMQVGASETSLGATLSQAGAQFVVAMSYSVTVSAAQRFMQTFYRNLFDHGDTAKAVRRARQTLRDDKVRSAYFQMQIELEDWLLPVTYRNSAVELKTREWKDQAEREAHYAVQANCYRPIPPTYGFFGRDLDVLAVERHVLRQNLLLIRGMGGAGKSALLRHLGEWWQSTGFVDEVFYFGWDEKAWNRQQILRGVAEKLLPAGEFHGVFEPMSEEGQQAYLAEKLRGTRHLLILDNLESITGTQMAIKNTLPEEERAKLKSLLRSVEGGKTVVLMGSRAGEEWLLQGLRANTYELPGLDEEAATALADEVLRRQKATQYRQDPTLRETLKLLGGYPLPIEVVLANLPKQSPAEVLKALKEGLPGIDSGDEDKTKSLVACIDYSFGNLAKEDQELLLTLAPFTGVVFKPILADYTKSLKAQPALAHLPFERWQEVVWAAADRGLLRGREDGFLTLQPILPYFLRGRLGQEGQAAVKAAIETAFRELYDQAGGELSQLARSKDAQERQTGLGLIAAEYENLRTAVELALTAKASFSKPYVTISNYLKSRQNYPHHLELSEAVWARRMDYGIDALAAKPGADFARVVEDIARCRLELKQLDAARSAYEAQLKWLAGIRPDSAGEFDRFESTAYHQLGIVAFEQGQWAQAEGHFRHALAISDEFRDRHRQAGTYHQLGIVAQAQRQWAQAEGHFRHALAIKAEFGDRYGQAATYHQLGTVAQAQGQWAQAEQHYRQALDIYIEFGDRYEQAGTYGQLAGVAAEQGQWAQAEAHFRQTLAIFVEFGDRYYQALTYHNLGSVAQAQRQWGQAEAHYQQALAIFVEFGDRYRQAGTYHQLGTVAQEQRQWGQAEAHYRKALAIYVELEDQYRWYITLRNLMRLWRESGLDSVPETVAGVLGISRAEAEELLRKKLEEFEQARVGEDEGKGGV